jgi:probable rRNA maturation factor
MIQSKHQIIIQNRTKKKIEEKFLRSIIKTSLGVLKIDTPYEIGLLLVDNKFITALNRQYRGIDSSTDVLAFSVLDKKGKRIDRPDGILHLGDVVISVDQAQKQSQEVGHSFKLELAILLVHGILHIFGFTHERSPNQKKMDQMSEKILDKLITGKINNLQFS